ncbi:Rrf2 family transcriptional regulator [Candidatus Enterococcus ferrettii]|uniref:Rrf2 family transcriptional regulator n=1 Tax=Candidatus Enterococcus ferrettii TaxID=2815324 RepID=A0ABV0ESE3_9ENTE|nr:Rrf2 family transcriptional regulator [Enterococcus sp. 665A]MBO1343142.1 Rrf2 family transcriptional regulator [Enterococcus sp. 665A]
MKYSIQLSDAIHILAYIEIFKNTDWLSSDRIAKSVETNPANIRKIMSQLRKSNLIITQAGKPTPTLAKQPEEISLLAIYKSIEGNTNLIQVDPKTNPNCIVGANIQEVLAEKYTLLQRSIEKEMSEITLDSFIHEIAQLEIEKRPENRTIVDEYL